MTQTTGYDTALGANPLELRSGDSGSNSSSKQPKGYALKVTEEMRSRFNNKLDEYVQCVAGMWREAGDDPDSEAGVRGLATVRQDMNVPEREEWMHPLDAIGTITSDDEYTRTAATHLDARDAMRTIWGMSENDYHQLLADSYGVTRAHLREEYGVRCADRVQRIADLNESRTALYRHYDADSVLLYVGITADIKNRESVHNVLSPWWGYVASSETEWYVDRRAAMAAERSAIRSGDPIFNIIHSTSVACHKRQTDYIRSAQQV